MNNRIINIEAGKPYRWEQGKKLKALQDVLVIFPAEILIDGATIGSIIELSREDVNVYFQKQSEQDEKTSIIVFELPEGTTMKIKRNVEMLAKPKTGTVAAFEECAI